MSDAEAPSAGAGRHWSERARDWAEIQEAQCRSVYEAVFAAARLGAGMAYLDVGCGAGLALSLAAQHTRVLCGLDAAHDLLQIARQRVPNADLRHGELQQLPFADNSFDLVTGFNAFQYADDPVRALREARRVARAGALVVVMTWAPPEGMPAAQLVAALKPLLPAPAPGAPGPFALSAEPALRALAVQAGLVPEQIVDVDCPWQYTSLAEGVRGLNASGVAARARAHSGEAAVTRAHTEALRPFAQADGSCRIGAHFRCLFARA